MADRASLKSLRCAVYTRKSSEEGLEQDFNSLQAQREACEAFIKSQRHEGWKLIETHYDDGGYSGGTMERPALQRLLEDIRARKVDVVVVYKVDRLTRALTDFAKIVETFDQHGVSFVSVTQQFNTTSSMGRLTLNVLLSFAQFEREVTGERIRDKVAASKKKGMWVGGWIPMGYNAKDRSIVIDEVEARIIRTIFRLYGDLKNVRLVHAELDRRKLRTRRYQATTGRIIGDRPFSRGHIYQILSNPIYVGEIEHKGTRHPGQHKAIIDKQIWDAVQITLQTNGRERRVGRNTQESSLLAGLLFDEAGNRLTATHTAKGGRRYRYYVNASLGRPDSQLSKEARLRISAPEIEAAVIEQLAAFLRDFGRLMNTLELHSARPKQVKAALAGAARLASAIDDNSNPNRRTILSEIVDRIGLGHERLSLSIKRGPLLARISGAGSLASAEHDEQRSIQIDAPLKIVRRGLETRLILPGRDDQNRDPDQSLIKAIARGYTWFDRLIHGQARSVAEIANAEGVTEGYVRRLLDMALLPPTLVEDALSGRRLSAITTNHLRSSACWMICPP